MEAYLEISNGIICEAEFFVKSLLFGMGLRLLYDFFIVFRRLVKHSIFFVSLEDVLFCMLACVLTFSMSFYENNGAFRAYSIIGIIMGMLIYHFGPGRLFGYLLEKLMALFIFPLKFIKKICHKMLK